MTSFPTPLQVEILFKPPIFRVHIWAIKQWAPGLGSYFQPCVWVCLVGDQRPQWELHPPSYHGGAGLKGLFIKRFMSHRISQTANTVDLMEHPDFALWSGGLWSWKLKDLLWPAWKCFFSASETLIFPIRAPILSVTELLYSLLQHRKPHEIHRHSTSKRQEPLFCLWNPQLLIQRAWKEVFRLLRSFVCLKKL